MALNSASAWQTAWGTAAPPVADDSWKANLANFVDAQVTSKLTSNGLFSAPGTGALSFTFAKAAFQSALAAGDITTIASAFESAWLASTWLVAPGAFIGSDSPATKFSVVASCIPDAASITLAKAKIIQIGSLPHDVSDRTQSQFPVKVREAFLLLTITTTGTNSVAPTPAPLTDPLRALQ